MFGALAYLRLTSIANLVLFRLRRLRQPKYLIGTAAAIGYFYFFFVKRMSSAWSMSGSAMGGGPAAAGTPQFVIVSICFLMAGLALIRIAFAWISPAETPGFRFTEAEIAFLFPAPIPRKTLIHYRLLSAQIAILFTAAVIALVFNRTGSLGGHRVFRMFGWWIILSIFDLHVNGTKLTLSHLRERSAHYLRWRVAAVAAIVVYAAAVCWTAFLVLSRFTGGEDFSRGTLDRATATLLGSSAFHWLSLPFRIIFGPYLATDTASFLTALLPALVVFGLHYVWVLNTQASFEEGSIALAEKRAAVKAAAASGEFPGTLARRKAHSGPFPLRPVGPPEFAFLWKNLLSMRSMLFSRRVLIIFLAVLVWMLFALGPLLSLRTTADGGAAIGHLIVLFCGMIAGYTLLIGPQLARQDLRGDLPNADLLKTYPVEGWRLALGELLAPTLLLSIILWTTIFVAAAAIDVGHPVAWLTPPVRVTIVVCLSLGAPLVCLLQLIVPNTIMVLFPAWYQAARSRTAGVEMFGQRILFGVMQLLVALLVLVPAAGWAVLVFFCSQWVVGVGVGVVLATIAVVPMLGGEAAVGLWWLGERFAAFDLSTEQR
jgi:ABC-2 type transport system permease protein